MTLAISTSSYCGKYRLLEVLSEGRAATLYQASRDGVEGIDRLYTIKKVHQDLSKNAAFIDAYLRSTRINGRLTHKNIAQTLDVGQTEDSWFIAMEYVHGTHLRSVLSQLSTQSLRLPLPHVLYLTQAVLDALEYAHSCQLRLPGEDEEISIIHGGVVPHNVLVSFQGDIKLTNFGTENLWEGSQLGQDIINPHDWVYRSPQYLEFPDVLHQHDDVYGTSILLYELTTGQLPYLSRDPGSLLQEIHTKGYIPVLTAAPETPAVLAEIIERAMSVDPKERYPSARAFREALGAFFDDYGLLFTQSNLASYLVELTPNTAKESTKPLTAIEDPLDAEIPPLEEQILSRVEPSQPSHDEDDVDLLTLGPHPDDELPNGESSIQEMDQPVPTDDEDLPEPPSQIIEDEVTEVALEDDLFLHAPIHKAPSSVQKPKTFPSMGLLVLTGAFVFVFAMGIAVGVLVVLALNYMNTPPDIQIGSEQKPAEAAQILLGNDPVLIDIEEEPNTP